MFSKHGIVIDQVSLNFCPYGVMYSIEYYTYSMPVMISSSVSVSLTYCPASAAGSAAFSVWDGSS